MVLDTSGPRRVRNATAARRNVGDVERVLSVLGGGALAAAGVRQRGAGGVLLALLGAELVRRGATGRCFLYESAGISTAGDGKAMSTHRPPHDFASAAATVDARQSVKVEHGVTVRVPRETLYAYWRDFTNHPRFMQHVESVEPRDGGRVHWILALPIGGRLEWDSEIVNDIPNELIAWKTVGNPDVAHAGSVHFRDAPGARGTEVKVVMDYEPPGGRPGRLISKLFGVAPDQLVKEDLRRFKQLMEKAS